MLRRHHGNHLGHLLDRTIKVRFDEIPSKTAPREENGTRDQIISITNEQNVTFQNPPIANFGPCCDVSWGEIDPKKAKIES
jgi:hypothetical protein